MVDEGREDREASFKRLCKRRLGGSKETDTGQRPEILDGELYVEECHYLK
jgi:hypothetical protein